MVGITVLPFKADTPLRIDANAVLPCPISSQLFQTICGWDPKIIQRYSTVQHTQFAQGHLLDILRQSPERRREKILSVSLHLKDLIIVRMIYRNALNVKHHTQRIPDTLERKPPPNGPELSRWAGPMQSVPYFKINNKCKSRRYRRAEGPVGCMRVLAAHLIASL